MAFMEQFNLMQRRLISTLPAFDKPVTMQGANPCLPQLDWRKRNDEKFTELRAKFEEEAI